MPSHIVKGNVSKALKRRDNTRSYHSINSGDICTIENDGVKQEWLFKKKIPYTSMKKGEIYGLSFKTCTIGYDIFTFDGYSDIGPTYGRSGPCFDSIKDVQTCYAVKTLADIENIPFEQELDYGNKIYMCTTSLISKNSGCFYYVFNGKWSSGNGVNPLTFWYVELTKDGIIIPQDINFSDLWKNRKTNQTFY